MTSIEIAFNEHVYTIEYEIIMKGGVCEACKQKKDDIEKLNIIYIVRQQNSLDGENIDIKSSLGKKITEYIKIEVIGEENCFNCRVEMNC